jgi:hypothetical protein
LKRTGGVFASTHWEKPAGYFANCYSKEEVQEENRLAKSSVVRPPADLE